MEDYILQARRAFILKQIAERPLKKSLFTNIAILGFSPEARALAIGVAKVESTARPSWFRFVEAIVSMINAWLSLLTGQSPRNYTVGPLQIGVRTSLKWTNSHPTPLNYIRRLALLLQIKGSLRIFKCGYRFHIRSIGVAGTTLADFSKFYNGTQSLGKEVSYQEALSAAIKSVKDVSSISLNRENKFLNSPQIATQNDLTLALEQSVSRRLDLIRACLKNGDSLAAVVVLCNHTARKATHSIYVGPDVQQQPALQKRRLVGSVLKIPLYICYIDQFKASLGQNFIDQPTQVISDGQELQPRNADHKYRGPVTMQYAFAFSINTVAIQIAEKLKIEKFVAYLRKSGIYIPLPNSLLLALGAVRLTIWEVLALFSPVMTNGYLSWIDDSDSNHLSPLNNGARIASQSAVNTMKTLLRTTAENGTAGYLLNKNPLSLGGKTGTSEKSRDLWFVGAIDENTYGAVWIGNQDEQPLIAIDDIPISASRFAVPMWSDVVETFKNGT
jgi:hypothetical protein